MTDRPGPSSQRPAPAPSGPPRTPQAWSGGVRRVPGEAGDLDDARLAPREEALIAQAMTTVAQRGRGPVVAGTLVVAAFLLGLLRPWDLLVPPAAPTPERATVTPSVREGVIAPTEGTDPRQAAVMPSEPTPRGTPPPVPRRAPTCAYPSQWRSSTIEDWAGRQARVWKAVEVVEASGPQDPAIPFEPIVAATVTALGWCAPVDGPDRPPLALVASLFAIRDGLAIPVVYDRLEPAAPDALGELWVPLARGVGNRPGWPMGRYVIELRSESGGYVRYLGLELTDRVIRPSMPPP